MPIRAQPDGSCCATCAAHGQPRSDRGIEFIAYDNAISPSAKTRRPGMYGLPFLLFLCIIKHMKAAHLNTYNKDTQRVLKPFSEWISVLCRVDNRAYPKARLASQAVPNYRRRADS